MFTEQELAKAKRISTAVTERFTKEATAASWYSAHQPQAPISVNNQMPGAEVKKPFLFGTNHEVFPSDPVTFRNDWDIATPKNYSWFHPAPRMTFGDTLGIAGRGLGKQLGTYAQMTVGGHNGGSGFAHNVVNDIGSALTGQYHSGDLTRSFTEPYRRATSKLNEAYNLTGAPADYLAHTLPGVFNSHTLGHPISTLRDWMATSAPK